MPIWKIPNRLKSENRNSDNAENQKNYVTKKKKNKKKNKPKTKKKKKKKEAEEEIK